MADIPREEPPATCGRPLRQWPDTVAVVAYGSNRKYDDAMMWDGGSSRFVAVHGPSDICRWAGLNGLRCVDWHLPAWLPNSPEWTLMAPYQSTGLNSSGGCWDSALLQPLAMKLIQSILQSPADVVMS